MPVRMERNRESRGRLGKTWSQCHVGTPFVIMASPVVKKTSQMGTREGNHKIEQCSPERPEYPFTDRIDHGRPPGKGLWRDNRQGCAPVEPVAEPAEGSARGVGGTPRVEVSLLL
jgi:hypothetical protein